MMNSAKICEPKQPTEKFGPIESCLQETKHTLACIWQQLSAREHNKSGNTVSLPYHTLRYIDEVERAFELSYCVCPVTTQQKSLLKQIEIECHALEAAIHARELFVTQKEQPMIKSIFIALRVLFKEFKEDRLRDGEQRLESFVKHLHKLMIEMAEVFHK